MSCCLIIQDKDNTFIGCDTAISYIDNYNNIKRYSNDGEKLFNINNNIIFVSGNVDKTKNVIDYIKTNGMNDIEYYLNSIVDCTVENKIYELEIIIYSNNSLYQYSQYNNFKPIIYNKITDSSIRILTCGIKTKKCFELSRKEVKNKIDVVNIYNNVFNQMICDEIGGNLCLYRIYDNMITYSTSKLNDNIKCYKDNFKLNYVCADTLMGSMILGENLVIRDAEGTLNIKGNLLEIKDRNNKLKVQLGEYKHNVFGLKLFSNDGKNVVLDENGLLQTYQIDNCGNVDNGYPLRMRVFVPSGCKKIKRCLLSFYVDRFRAYSTGTSTFDFSTTTGASANNMKIELTSTDDKEFEGETTDGGECKFTSITFEAENWEAGENGHDHGIKERVRLAKYGGDIGVTDKEGKVTGYAVKKATSGEAWVEWVPSGQHTHKVEFVQEAHTHKYKIPTHSHSITMPEHGHKVTIPGHKHDIKYGIYEDYEHYPSVILVYINGSITHYCYPENNVVKGIDLSEFLQIGKWNDIFLYPSDKGYLQASVFVQGLFGTNEDDQYY